MFIIEFVFLACLMWFSFSFSLISVALWLLALYQSALKLICSDAVLWMNSKYCMYSDYMEYARLHTVFISLENSQHLKITNGSISIKLELQTHWRNIQRISAVFLLKMELSETKISIQIFNRINFIESNKNICENWHIKLLRKCLILHLHLPETGSDI